MLQEEKQTDSAPLNEIMAFIHSTSWKGSQLGLSRIIGLLELLGNPQKKLKFVHIAGTNGKGSTAAMIASVLQEARSKTGLYTSPFIHEFGERIQINSIPITNRELGDMVNQLRGSPRLRGDTVFLISALKERLDGEIVEVSAYRDRI